MFRQLLFGSTTELAVKRAAARRRETKQEGNDEIESFNVWAAWIMAAYLQQAHEAKVTAATMTRIIAMAGAPDTSNSANSRFRTSSAAKHEWERKRERKMVESIVAPVGDSSMFSFVRIWICESTNNRKTARAVTIMVTLTLQRLLADVCLNLPLPQNRRGMHTIGI